MIEHLWVGLLTAATTMAGGLWVASQPRTWLTSARLAQMMALGAGLLLAVVCFELLPAAVEHGGEHAFGAVFAGLLTVLLFERYVAPRLTFLNPPGSVACHVDDHGPCAHDPGHAHEHDHAHAPAPSHAMSLFSGPGLVHDEERGGVATLAPPVAAACPHDHGAGPTHVHNHDHHDGHGHLLSHGAACSALGCLLVCTFFDGIAMSAGFSLGMGVGLLIAFGLALHMLPEGVLASTVVLASGNSATLARRAAVATGIAFLLGMAIPAVAGTAMGSMLIALPFAAGVLLYVVLAQLLPVAMRHVSGVPLVAAGALLFGILERLVPHSH